MLFIWCSQCIEYVWMNDSLFKLKNSRQSNAEGLDALFALSRVHCDNKTWQIGINRDYSSKHVYETDSWQFMNVGIRHIQCEYSFRNESHFTCYSHCYATWCLLTTGELLSHNASIQGTLKHHWNHNQTYFQWKKISEYNWKLWCCFCHK